MYNDEDKEIVESMISSLDISGYTYTLPQERIAKFPVDERDASKLLVYNKGKILHDKFINMERYISEDNTLVFNNSKVIQARLEFYKDSGARIEIFCLEPVEPSDIQLAFQQTRKVSWKCLVGNQKKWKQGSLTKKVHIGEREIRLTALLRNISSGGSTVEFSWSGSDLTFSEVMENAGDTPIPPYLKREPQPLDRIRYQTVYSSQKGSVAAPTAGLHFSDEVLNRIREKGINTTELTLHVGIGTFRPIQTNSLLDHEMHSEHFSVTKAFVQTLRRKKNRVIAVGTTSVRTIESLYLLGRKIHNNPNIQFEDLLINQWDGIRDQSEIPPEIALGYLEEYMNFNGLDTLHAATRLMIIPGYRFRVTRGIITNFHMPRSSLIILVAAFIGDDWKRVYQYAMENEFRFLSYGDSSILFPGGQKH